jgi:hypothetical protein
LQTATFDIANSNQQQSVSTAVVDFAIPFANYNIWYCKFKKQQTKASTTFFEFVIPFANYNCWYRKFKQKHCVCSHVFLNLQNHVQTTTFGIVNSTTHTYVDILHDVCAGAIPWFLASHILDS